MDIVGFSLTKILLDRKETPIKKLDIKSKIKFSSIEKQNIKFLEGKDTLKVNFEYEILYSPDLAQISFKGHLLFASNPKEAEEILDEWNKNKKIKKEVQLKIYNFVFMKCNLKALHFEEEFNLPPHINLPQIRIESKESK